MQSNKLASYLPGDFTRPIHTELQLVPDSLTQVTGSNSVIKHAHFMNRHTDTVLITVVDKQDTPRYLLYQHPIPAKYTLTMDYPAGIPMKGGIQWLANVANVVDGILLGNSANG